MALVPNVGAADKVPFVRAIVAPLPSVIPFAVLSKVPDVKLNVPEIVGAAVVVIVPPEFISRLLIVIPEMFFPEPVIVIFVLAFENEPVPDNEPETGKSTLETTFEPELIAKLFNVIALAPLLFALLVNVIFWVPEPPNVTVFVKGVVKAAVPDKLASIVKFPLIINALLRLILPLVLFPVIYTL